MKLLNGQKIGLKLCLAFKDNVYVNRFKGNARNDKYIIGNAEYLISSQHIIKALTNNESENITIVKFIRRLY